MPDNRPRRRRDRKNKRARRVRSRLLRRGLVRRRLSTAACVVLVATSVTVPAVAAIAADSNGQGTSLPGAAATNRLSAVTAAPTLPIKYVESASGANVDVRPNITVPPAPKVKTEVAGLRTERSATYENPNGTFSLQLGSCRDCGRLQVRSHREGQRQAGLDLQEPSRYGSRPAHGRAVHPGHPDPLDRHLHPRPGDERHHIHHGGRLVWRDRDA